jgi:small subunit ribosomal protein S18
MMSSNSPMSSSSGGPQKRPAKKKFFVRRKRVCKFTVEKIGYIDFKDVKLLSQFVPERSKILPRRISGTSAFYQRKLARAIKRARYLAFLPYVAD